MSEMNVDAVAVTRSDIGGVLVSTPYLDQMGWLHPSRVWKPQSVNRSLRQEFDLESLGHPETPGLLAAIVGDKYKEARIAVREQARRPTEELAVLPDIAVGDGRIVPRDVDTFLFD